MYKTPIYRFLNQLKAYRPFLTQQQYKTLRGQALAGDVYGAWKGLDKVLNRKDRRA